MPIAHRGGAWRCATRALVAVLAIVTLSSVPSSAEEDPANPGLPLYDPPADWNGPRASGIAQSDRAQQWFRMPPVFAAAAAAPQVRRFDLSCRRLRPYQEVTDFRADVYLRSSAGGEHPYGDIGPFTVRTVAFGAIPVEADVVIRQLRDEDGLPVPFVVTQRTGIFCPGLGPNAGPTDAEPHIMAARFVGPVQLELAAVRVDGHELVPTPGCRAVSVSTLDLSGRELYEFDPAVPDSDRPTKEHFFTTPYFSLANGGMLTGTVDVPAFTGCTTTSGEDVSSLLTAAVSGPGNPVQIRTQGLVAFDCVRHGTSCPTVPDLPLPAAEARSPRTRHRR